MATVVFDKVCKVYTRGETPAVDRFSLEVGDGEYVGECRFECGCDLEVDVLSCLVGADHTETFTEQDVRDWFVNAEYCAWAKDENGNDVLLCFGAC